MRNKLKALLLAVPTYEQDHVADLPIALNDLKIMKDALSASSYELNVEGDEKGSPLTRTRLYTTINTFLTAADPDDTILVYFTGHGINLNGKDYLLPSDASLADPNIAAETLFPCDLDQLIARCAAKTVVIFIDACREGADIITHLDSKAAGLQGWSSRKVQSFENKQVIYIYSCGAGQFSRFSPGDDGTSIFTNALALLLSPSHPATTLNDILEFIQTTVDNLSRQYSKPTQTVRIGGEFNAGAARDSTVLCIRSRSTRSIKNYSLISEIVCASTAWTNQPTSAGDFIGKASSELARVEKYLTERGATPEKSLSNDLDETQEERCIHRLLFLIQDQAGKSRLSAIELYTIAMAFILNRAIRREFMKVAAGINNCLSGELEVLVRQSFNSYQSKYAYLFEAATSRDESDTTVSKIELWLQNTWLADDQDLWLLRTQVALKDLLSSAPEATSGSILHDQLMTEKLARMVRSINTVPVGGVSGQSAFFDQATTYFASSPNEQVMRDRALASVIFLASIMGVRVNSLGSEIADTLLTDDPIVFEEVLTALNNATWVPIREERALNVACKHPALDAALTRLTEFGDEYLQYLRSNRSDINGLAEIVPILPARLSADNVRSARNGDRHYYVKPHISLRLVDRKVRELLMGDQLYGDPELAIREIYQNAIDACRYRSARLMYLEANGAPISDWKPKIVLREGIDQQNRRFVECEDNGIGMTHSHLMTCFACAGRRFAELPEYIQESLTWETMDPPIRLYPNSQFGIGVFAYFMLGDQILVKSRRFNEDGTMDNCLEATVGSASGLFRVQRSAVMLDGGTVVRIYLKNDSRRQSLGRQPHLLLRKSLENVLGHVEFHTEILTDTEEVIYEAGTLLPLARPQASLGDILGAAMRGNGNVLTEVTTSNKVIRYSAATSENDRFILTAPGNIWWLEAGAGPILSDGIITDKKNRYAVINLFGPNLPKLTVDRKKIQDLNQDIIDRLLKEAVLDLPSAPWFCYRWLWTFAQTYPELADILVEHLLSNDPEAVLPLNHPINSEDAQYYIKIRLAQCFPPDLSIIDVVNGRKFDSTTLPPFLAAVRCRVLRNASANDDVALESPQFLKSINTSHIFKATYWEMVLSKILTNKKNWGQWVQGGLGPTEIIFSAIDVGVSPRALFDQLDQQKDLLGLALNVKNKELLPTDKLNRICATLLRSNDSLNDKQKIWRSINLFDSSIRLGISPKEIAAQLRPFESLGILSISAEANVNCEHKFDQIDADLKQRDNSHRKFLTKQKEEQKRNVKFDVFHIMSMMAKHNLQAVQVAQRINTLREYFGESEKICTPSFTEERPDFLHVLLSRKLDGMPPWVGPEISAGHRLRFCIKADISRADFVATYLPIVQVLGLVCEKLKSDGSNLETDSQFDRIVVSIKLDGESPWISGRISLGHIIGAAALTEVSCAEVYNRLLELRDEIGFSLPDCSPSFLDYKPINSAAIIASRNMNGRHPWLHGMIRRDHQFRLAMLLDLQIGEVHGILNHLKKYLPIELEDGANSTNANAAMGQLAKEVWGFNRHGRLKRKLKQRVGPADFVHVAIKRRVAVAKVVEYLGPILDWIWPSENSWLKNLRSVPAGWPDDDATLVLSKVFLKSLSFKTLGHPGEIISISQSTRLSIGSICSIIIDASVACSRPEPDFKFNKVADASPSTNELIVLSKEGNGRERWISGEIPLGHIAQSSFKANLPVSEVIETLEKFEEFLGLKLAKVRYLRDLTYTADQVDCALFSSQFDGQAPWINDASSKRHLQIASSILGLDADILCKRIATLHHK